MEKDRTTTENGQELAAQDWNATTHLAAVTQDYLVQELFRPWPNSGGGAVSKGVIPYGYNGPLVGVNTSNGTDPRHAGLVQSTNSTNPSLRIYPFRALIGTTDDFTTVPPLEQWREARSVVVADPVGGALALPLGVNLSATIANNRCDLVYLHITVAAVTASETRFVRDPGTGALSQPTLDVELSDTFEILIAQSAEATNPTRPSLPADSGGDFYIPLAYCYLLHPSPGGVSPTLVHEVAPVIPISRATSAATLQPANQQWNPSGPMLTATPFALATTPHRPDTYIAPSMNGQEGRICFFKWDGATKSPPVAGTFLVDSSCDWRNRIFTWRAQARKDSGASRPAWSGAGVTKLVPSGFALTGSEQYYGFGQSFVVDTLAPFGISNGAAAAVLDPSTLTALLVPVIVHVDVTTGNLLVTTSANPGANVFLWLEATGPFDQVVGGIA